MFRYLKNNFKGILIVVIASLLIAIAKANFKHTKSIAYAISNDLYKFAGVDIYGKKMTIANRIKKEADDCLDGYAFSSWSFERDAQIYRNDTIYGCTGAVYGDNRACYESENLKTKNNAYVGNYVLEDGWFEDLLLKSSDIKSPKVFECNFKDGKICPEIEKVEFFKFQIFCSIQGTMNPVRCEEIIDNMVRRNRYVEVDGDLVEVKMSPKEAREHYINQIVNTRNPIKNLKFIIVKEKDPRFLRAIILTDMSDSNMRCDGNLGSLRLISFVNSLE